MATPTQPAGDGVVDGWAVLAERDYYEEKTDFTVDYINITQLHQLLLDFGWQESHIRELREFGQEELRQALDWLAANADEDDVVFLYVFAHSSYLREDVHWSDFFADEWAAIPSQRRMLMVDACHAGAFTAAVNDDPRPHLSIAAVSEDEYAWAGVPEEGLPIIGGVFTHYFAAAFADPEADADGDGKVSIQEAARRAEGQQRMYMHDVVLAVPEFLEMYHQIDYYPERDPEFPHVVVDDTLGEPVYLELNVQ